tara:strand:+ start:537 stop:788 length:252 start_codon:yes stop_codon:yes gene_type:complete
MLFEIIVLQFSKVVYVPESHMFPTRFGYTGHAQYKRHPTIIVNINMDGYVLDYIIYIYVTAYIYAYMWVMCGKRVGNMWKMCG